MRNFITNFMFMINGPGPMEEKSKSLAAAISTISEVTSSGLFAGDCLLTWAKNLGFLDDAKFMNVLKSELTGDYGGGHDLAVACEMLVRSTLRRNRW
jgi:hypothetical protein